MSTADQTKLEQTVNKLIKSHGVNRAIDIIKSKTAAGIFRSMQNYPRGVFIYCSSEKGGILVGQRD